MEATTTDSVPTDSVPTGADAAGSGPAGVWSELVGQEPLVEVLRYAVAGADSRLRAAKGHDTGGTHGAGGGMSHAWLLTGPPGSGRSTAARAFVAALQCPDQGCGECTACKTALAGSHPDVTLVRTEHLSLRVDEIRDLVVKAAMSPVGERWQLLVVEDADRLTEQAADALLKSLEEPPERTVWVLCAPTVEDVVPTIRSRCRLLVLRTPRTEAVAQLLRDRLGVESSLAWFAARASQGHIGRARALATDEVVRDRRREVLELPGRLGTVAASLHAAQQIVDASTAEAKVVTEELDAKEQEELERALGMGTRGTKPRHAQAALRELQDQQKVRAKRLQRDALDRVLLDLMSYYRDVLALALQTGADLVNEELRPQLEQRARQGAEQALHAIDAITQCREAILANVAPLLAVETMLLALRGDGSQP